MIEDEDYGLVDTDISSLEKFAILMHGDRVDYRTGEILAVRKYVSIGKPHFPPDNEEQAFRQLTSVSQRDRFLQKIDKRRLTTLNHARQLYDEDKGTHQLTGRPIHLPNRIYERLQLLIAGLDYQNYLITTPDRLAKLLGVPSNHVQRSLKAMGGLVRVYSTREGMRRGTLKIAISPAYAYRYERYSVRWRRDLAIRRWYDPHRWANF